MELDMFMRKKDKNNTDKKESLLVTKESFCSTCALFSFLALLMLCTRSVIFGDLGIAIHSFLTGAFGYMAYPLVLGAGYLSVMGLFGIRLVKNRRLGASIVLATVCVSLIVHTALTFTWDKAGYVEELLLSL